MPDQKVSVLIVCSGNTCRSPMAAALLLQAGRSCPGFTAPEVFSAGLAAADGEKASEHARGVMREAGIDLEKHISVLLNEEQVGKATLILVMTRRQRELLLQRYPAAVNKTYLLKEYAGIAGNPDVADPYGGSIEEYRRVYQEIRTGIEKIMQLLKRGEHNEDSPGQ